MLGIDTYSFNKIQEYIQTNRLIYSYRPHNVDGDKVTYHWHSRNSDAPIYLVIGNDKALTLALLCGLIPSKDEKPWRAAIIPPRWLANHPELEKMVDKWLEPEFCRLDVRSADCPITMREEQIPGRFWADSWLTYSGDVSKRLAMSYAKTVFSETVAKYWSGEFIVGSEHRMSKKLTGMARAKVLAKAIMLGKEVDVPVGGRTGAKLTGLKADALMSTTFNIGNMPQEARDIVKSVQVFRDYAELWGQAIRDNRFFAMRVDEKDLEERPDEVVAAFQKGAEFINLDIYLEPYREGVPIEDIVFKDED